MDHSEIAAILVVAAVLAPTAGAVTPAGASVAGAVTPAGASVAPTEADPAVSIVAAYPDAIASGEPTEFVVLRVRQRSSLRNVTLSDGDRRVRLPNVTVSDRVVLARAPARVRNLTGERVLPVPDLPRLANAGETLVLTRGETTVDTVRYEEATEGSIASWTGGVSPAWRPIGATRRPVVTGSGGDVEAFVLPDGRRVVPRVMETARERILLAGYTFTSRRVAEKLIDASRRGATVRVLLEGEPIGGITTRQARLLDRLVASGITVRVLTGPYERYAYHHAKYAVVDDRAIVTTENFKPAGTGGRSSRGWGVVVDQPRIVEGLAATFEADADWRAATSWSTFRRGRTFESGHPTNGTYPREFEPRTVPVQRTELLVTPDNAKSALVETMDGANRSLRIVQVSASRNGPFLRAAIRAAKRGVEVEVLLGSAWYVREENEALATDLNGLADSRDLPLEARLATPGDRFEKIHAKGVIVDGRTVAVGSLNWNPQAATENRETVVLLHGEAAADYYGRVFDADWSRAGGSTGVGPRGLPVGLIVAAAGCALLAVLVASRFEFER